MPSAIRQGREGQVVFAARRHNTAVNQTQPLSDSKWRAARLLQGGRLCAAPEALGGEINHGQSNIVVHPENAISQDPRAARPFIAHSVDRHEVRRVPPTEKNDE